MLEYGVNTKADGVVTWICCALADIMKELLKGGQAEVDGVHWVKNTVFIGRKIHF